MTAQDRQGGWSSVLLDEYFDAADDRFVDEVRKCPSSKKLASLGTRWGGDPRPWARKQMLAYLSQPLDRPGHHPLVKRLFKSAEARKDHEMMAAFLVAFDRLVRRRRTTRYRYDRSAGGVVEEESLVKPRNSILSMDGDAVPLRFREGLLLFSSHTRDYLRRRAWRYFRRLGYAAPGEYPAAVAVALQQYVDSDFAKGENILDNWGLMHAGYADHDALEFTAGSVRLGAGRSVGELSPAPYFAELWKKPEAMKLLLSVALEARSRLVRLWAMDLLRAHHREPLTADLAGILSLLDSVDGDVQQFAAEVLQNAPGLEAVDLPVWMRLLGTRNPVAIAILAGLMKKHVSPSRLTPGQCVDLACAAPSPVAGLGLDFLRQQTLATPEHRRILWGLAGAKCPALAAELTAYALSVLGAAGTYDRDGVMEFFDSLTKETRRAAWEWLKPGCPGYQDPALWCRLVETPHDDVRLSLVDLLARRASLPGTKSDALGPVWCSVLLGVHRGGRQKLKAVRQVARAIREDASRAAALLPVMAVAVRSVRGPEHRAGLAAVAEILEARPDLEPAARLAMPELKCALREATA